jgi:hypothetical protein
MISGSSSGRLAQLVERYVHIVEVTGSSPVATIGIGKELPDLFLLCESLPPPFWYDGLLRYDRTTVGMTALFRP